VLLAGALARVAIAQHQLPAGLTLTPAALFQPDPTSAAQQSAPLIVAPDRPGLGDSTQIVPSGHVGLEFGYLYTYSDHNGVTTQTQSAPQALIRVGIHDDQVELRLGATGFVYARINDGSGTATEDGFTDVVPGIKVRLWDQEPGLPRVCLLASTTVGLGSRDISSRDVEPMLEAPWSYKFSEELELDGSFAVSYASDGEDRFFQGSASVSLFYQFTQKFGGFIEYFVVGPNTKGSDAAHFIDGGVTYLLTDRIQLDASVGVGLNQEADNFFAGAGISFLF
jgi:hypothetical protein